MKRKGALWLFVAVLVLTVGFYLVTGDGLGLCSEGNNYRTCISHVNNISEPLFWSFLPLLAISFILLFVKRETFLAWVKFGVPAFVVMLAIILYTYNNTPQMGGWVNWGSDEEFATVLLPPLFFLISLAVIIYKQLKLRKSS